MGGGYQKGTYKLELMLASKKTKPSLKHPPPYFFHPSFLIDKMLLCIKMTCETCRLIVICEPGKGMFPENCPQRTPREKIAENKMRETQQMEFNSSGGLGAEEGARLKSRHRFRRHVHRSGPH